MGKNFILFIKYIIAFPELIHLEKFLWILYSYQILNHMYVYFYIETIHIPHFSFKGSTFRDISFYNIISTSIFHGWIIFHGVKKMFFCYKSIETENISMGAWG